MICENEEYARSQLGNEFSRKLITRLADIIAAQNVMEIPTGSPREIFVNGNPMYQIDILPPHFLIFRSVHEHQPFNENGHLNWNLVNRVQIIDIQ